MPKPSERIKEIISDLAPKETPYSPSDFFPKAILQYLDEEYEKKHRHPEGLKCNEC